MYLKFYVQTPSKGPLKISVVVRTILSGYGDLPGILNSRRAKGFWAPELNSPKEVISLFSGPQFYTENPQIGSFMLYGRW